MANLSVYVSSYVNGVAELHSEILKRDLFRDWYAVYPERFQNKTNGITPRRWLGLSNPELTELLESKAGAGFIKDLDRLADVKTMIDRRMIDRFNGIKYLKKLQLADYIQQHEGVDIDPNFIFDVQVKRLHEYKRQLMNAFSIMDLYFSLKDGTLRDFTPTVFIFGAKSAPGYVRAKAIIRYINHVARLINGDRVGARPAARGICTEL
jgi:starch phosphorylase